MIHPRRLFVTAMLVAGTLLASLMALDSAAAQPPVPGKTEEHELLKKDAGTWDAAMKLWPRPDAEPLESRATESNKLFGEGLWLVTHFDGEIGGMKFSGLGTLGYDPVEKKYVGTWIDSISPHLTTSKGDYDEETKTLTMTAQGRDLESGEVITAKHILKYADDDTRTFEIHMPGDDGEHWKMLEVNYTRRGE
jgi:hypothetical protein